MGEALMLLERIQCHYGVELLAHHVAGVDSTIADDRSRGATGCDLVRTYVAMISGARSQWWHIYRIVQHVSS